MKKTKKAVEQLVKMRRGFVSANKYGFNHAEFLWDSEKQVNKMIKSLEIGAYSITAMRKLSKILNLECPTDKDYDKMIAIIDKWEILCGEVKEK